jgi:dolichol-phosphate mannosyltransferase
MKHPPEAVDRQHQLPSAWEIPAFSTLALRSKNTAYCIIVFVINEGKKIRTQLEEMAPYARFVDIIIADGGSVDGSLDPTFLRKTATRTLLTKTGPGKLSAQMRMAFAYALTEGYRGVIVIDGNGKDDVSAIPNFVKALDQGYDHIQGSRFIPGGHGINTPLLRIMGVRGIHSPLMSLAARHRYTDTTNGFRAYSGNLLSDKRLKIFRNVFSGYELHYYLAIEAPRHDFRAIEIPVTRRYPKGQTPTKISPLKGNLTILATLLKAVVGRYRP